MLEFILERYNYWIFITLMMTGLYIVIARGNLVKTIVGLNLFQTSVFIFYISIGKIAGGTAPILLGGHGDSDHGEDAVHGEEAGHSAGGAHNPAGDAVYETNALNEEAAADAAHDAAAGGESLHGADGAAVPSNTLSAQTGSGAGDVATGTAQVDPNATGESLHQVPDALESTGARESIAAAAERGMDVIYTNPLPHVLILTAIVVGVATTAVGLALAVRIREAYGSIEEDELEREDHIAEFGVPLESQSTAEGSAA